MAFIVLGDNIAVYPRLKIVPLGRGTSEAEGVLLRYFIPPPPLRGYSSYIRRRIEWWVNCSIISKDILAVELVNYYRPQELDKENIFNVGLQ